MASEIASDLANARQNEHLTPEAQAPVQDLLGKAIDISDAPIALWANQIKWRDRRIGLAYTAGNGPSLSRMIVAF